MRVLLDECLPRRLRREFAGHNVSTVAEKGWAGVKNGELLQLAAPHFDVYVFLTVDSSIKHQQNIPALKIFVVTLRAKSIYPRTGALAENPRRYRNSGEKACATSGAIDVKSVNGLIHERE